MWVFSELKSYHNVSLYPLSQILEFSLRINGKKNNRIWIFKDFLYMCHVTVPITYSRKLIDLAYTPFHAVLKCGHLTADVQVFPRPEPFVIDEEIDPIPKVINTGNFFETSFYYLFIILLLSFYYPSIIYFLLSLSYLRGGRLLSFMVRSWVNLQSLVTVTMYYWVRNNGQADFKW